MNATRILARAALVAALAAGAALFAQSADRPQTAPRPQPAVGKVDLKTGDVVPIEATSRADSFRNERDREPIPRDFVQQPPLIPHGIKGYSITAKFNKCMDCHAWSAAPAVGATKVSQSHFRDQSGKELSNVSPRRYFCLQCHVPQTEATPLVGNSFKPLPALQQAPKPHKP
jgi:cytochrome c-type protein NapB